MTYFIGVDPDLHNMPQAIVDQDGKVIDLCVARVPARFKGRDAIQAMACSIYGLGLRPGDAVKAYAVEGQALYYQSGDANTKNPLSIVYLATVAGMALCRLKGLYSPAKDYFPTPQQWKGSIPKQIHQARILSRLGWEYEKSGSKEDGYCYPTLACSTDFNKGDWKHLVDAIGLALWARDTWSFAAEREARLAEEDAK